MGAIAGSLLSVPLYRASGRSIPLTLGWLAAPAAIAIAVWLPQVRAGREAAPDPDPDTGHDPVAGRPRAAGRKPIWRHALSWQVTLFMGMQSLLYYGSVSWLPTIFRDRGESASAAGGLLGVMGTGNLALALVAPVLAQRMRTQYALVIPIAIGIAAGTAGAVWAPLGTAVVWMLILGAAQNSALGVAIYFAMARAADPATAASLSAMAQGTGYLVASAGPLEVGLLHSATGSWNVPVIVLLALTVVLLVAGLLAARPRTISVISREQRARSRV